MRRILITGGAGAIGSSLVKRLCNDNDVLVLDDLSSGWSENIRGLPVKFWRGSITDDEILKEVFAFGPTVVFHLAANFANQNSFDYPQKDLAVNGLGTLKLLQYASEIQSLERFVYTSSSCVYGNISTPIDESQREYSLDTPYAVTKLLGEQYVAFYNRHHAMPTVILRLFNSYGPGEYPGKYRNVIPNFIYNAFVGIPIVITGDGTETRDYTYIDDTVNALLIAMNETKAIGNTYNTGTGIETSIGTLADMVVKICHSKSEIQFKSRRNWDSVTRRCSDPARLRRLGFSPGVGLQEGLEKTYQWFIDKRIAAYNPVA